MRVRQAVVAVLVAASLARADTSVPPNREQGIARRVEAYFAAMSRGDIRAVEAALSSDYTVIGGDGTFETRAERVKWLRENVKALASITPSELRVRIYGNTAVVTGVVIIRPDAKTPPVNERFTQVWVLQRGVWKMVTGQITVIAR